MSRIIRKEPDIGDIPIPLRIIHTITNHKLIWDLETDIVGLNRNKPTLRLIKARRNLQRSRLVLQEKLAQIAEGETSVENIFDDDDMLALDRHIQVFDE